MTQEELLNQKNKGNESKGDIDIVLDVNEAVKKAPQDKTPYLVHNDDKQYLVGDVSKTSKEPREYTIRFRLPMELAEKYGVKNPKVIGSVVELKFKEGLINPINEMNVNSSLITLMPYFKKFENKDEVKELSEQELLERYYTMSDEYKVAFATAAQGIFNIDDEIASYVQIPSAMNAVLQFVENNPDYVNVADFT